jgi:hypothetical protein
MNAVPSLFPMNIVDDHGIYVQPINFLSEQTGTERLCVAPDPYIATINSHSGKPILCGICAHDGANVGESD